MAALPASPTVRAAEAAAGDDPGRPPREARAIPALSPRVGDTVALARDTVVIRACAGVAGRPEILSVAPDGGASRRGPDRPVTASLALRIISPGSAVRRWWRARGGTANPSMAGAGVRRAGSGGMSR